jgi:hypothetical protein
MKAEDEGKKDFILHPSSSCREADRLLVAGALKIFIEQAVEDRTGRRDEREQGGARCHC